MSITLKSARINKGLTQVEAAKLIGVTKDTLSNYERGKSYPDVPIIKKIEQVYGVTYSEIKFLP
jgi:transcriptional regulator with XRE-family HTH domain|nr:MAG TPA: Repressor protein CI [Caudoviricetes sp.]DAR43232.1 MAG TPA: Repressor protein CI [Caudoviricetes sp.]